MRRRRVEEKGRTSKVKMKKMERMRNQKKVRRRKKRMTLMKIYEFNKII
jgi:hypothetical protein